MFFQFFKSKNRVYNIIMLYADKFENISSKSYISRIRKVAEDVRKYENVCNKKIFANNFTKDVILEFRNFLREKKILESTVNKKISIIFTCLRASAKTKNFDFDKIKFINDEPCTVALNNDELNRLAKIKLNKNDDRIRNMFLIGCYTGMRYSDYSQIKDINISSDIITRKTKKTGVEVVIPVHQTVKDIIKKQGGLQIYTGTQQNFNKRIKHICKKAMINEYVLIERIRGGVTETKRIRKYKLISSHTARRSFATNAYLANIPIARIMTLTGHKTEAAFFKYIRISREENAAILSKHEFFKTNI